MTFSDRKWADVPPVTPENIVATIALLHRLRCEWLPEEENMNPDQIEETLTGIESDLRETKDRAMLEAADLIEAARKILLRVSGPNPAKLPPSNCHWVAYNGRGSIAALP